MKWFVALAFIFCAGFWFFSYYEINSQTKDAEKTIIDIEKKEQQQREEVIKKGVTVSALIIDKKKVESTTLGTTDIMPFVIGNVTSFTSMQRPGFITSDYYLKIYDNEKNYDIVVPEDFYNKKVVGEHIKVKIYKDKIESLEE